jgi:hypothetical protein
VLGGYHIFLILVGLGFHKTIYKRVRFSLLKKKLYAGQGYQFFD